MDAVVHATTQPFTYDDWYFGPGVWIWVDFSVEGSEVHRFIHQRHYPVLIGQLLLFQRYPGMMQPTVG
jgi:hypothetical protein